ncbi:MAG: glycosyltransferase, group 1 family protein [Phycisphaerae bacterium]
MAVLAFCQHRLGRTDGVSLEVDKWRRVLEEMGHTVHYLAGNDDVPGGHTIPELYPFHPVTAKIIKNATRELVDYDSPAELMDEIIAHKAKVKPQMERFLDECNVDVMLPNNIISVGYNIPGMWALSEVLRETGLKSISHNHDFWWEDSGEVYPTCREIVDLYMQHAPPELPNMRYCVINRLAQAALKEKRGIDATVVPNVFDFDRPTWKEDDYNRTFRADIGVGPNDLLFLQATRVLDRKAIELAIDVIAELNKPENRKKLEGTLYDGRPFGPEDRIVLCCAGYVEGIGLSSNYPAALQARADEQGVELLWVGEHVKHDRGKAPGGEKIYSLWDSYVQADFVTYPSIWEGWGNQFIEAVFAKLPVVLFEYPVYVSDLKQVGFDVVSLGSELAGKDAHGLVTVPPQRLAEAADGVIHYLKDANARKAATDKNFQIAKEHFSMQALERIIVGLLDDVGL